MFVLVVKFNQSSLIVLHHEPSTVLFDIQTNTFVVFVFLWRLSPILLNANSPRLKLLLYPWNANSVIIIITLPKGIQFIERSFMSKIQSAQAPVSAAF